MAVRRARGGAPLNRLARLGLWWVPLLLVLVPLAGLMPAHRDLIDFFLPMRAATASMLASGTAPWLNFANGCGEAWFANPETAVLYPPAWLHFALPGPWALAAEIGLHLALFSLGVGLLAQQLGASRPARRLAEVAAWSAGPVLVTIGVLNNLETLTWLPWMVLAARLEGRRSAPLLAGATALGWLGGEPQVWALGLLVTLAVARRRGRALIGLGLGVAIVSVQLVPFLVWVAEGDRGPAAAWLLRGALTPADWSGVLVPGLSSQAVRMVYAESLFLGAPILVCALLGGWRRRWALAVILGLGLLATLPELGAGEALHRAHRRSGPLPLALCVARNRVAPAVCRQGRGRLARGTRQVAGGCGLVSHARRLRIRSAPVAVVGRRFAGPAHAHRGLHPGNTTGARRGVDCRRGGNDRGRSAAHRLASG